MNDQHGKQSTDLLGLAQFGEATKIVVQGAVTTAQEFFNAICLPAASEVGFLLRDKMRFWRAANLEGIARKSNQFLSVSVDGLQLHAPPRVVLEVIEQGSMTDDETIQEKWAGLLASSCTPDGNDETNLIFADLLKRITSSEARLLDYACNKSEKGVYENGIAFAFPIGASYQQMAEIMGLKNETDVDRQLQHLRTLGMIRKDGFIENHGKPNERRLEQITPERITLEFYVRCRGSRLTVREFFQITKVLKNAAA